MKRYLSFLLVSMLMLLSITAFSASYSEIDFSMLSDEELKQIISEAQNELNSRNTVKNESQNLGKIKDLFPDENFAIAVRDACGKLSIEQEVTQEDLDRIWVMNSTYVYDSIADLTGISLLRNCDDFQFWYTGKHLPEEMKYATWIKYITFDGSNLEEIPVWIDNLSELTTLILNWTKITSLPDSICNLKHLKYLDIASTNVSKLPDNIGNLTSLVSLDISHTKITKLPESIYNLSLESIRMEGLPIK